MSANWDPTTNADRDLKLAFSDLNASIDKVVLASSAGNRFILQSKGFFDLYAYILTGKDFPDNVRSFGRKIPNSAFEKLTIIDDDIYEKTRDTIINIGATCNEYHDVHAFKLATAGKAAIEYSESAVDLLEWAQDMNLKSQFYTLLDPKYKDQSSWNSEYEAAREQARTIIEMLKSQAKEKEEEIKQIVESMDTLKANTMKNLKDVDFLIKQYKTGPVQNKSDDKIPYFKHLNITLEKIMTSFTQEINNAAAKDSEWEGKNAATVATCLFGPIGWVAMGIDATEAQSLRDAYDALQTEIENSRGAETHLICYMTRVIQQCDGIDGKMATAIQAMTGLRTLFTAQAECYDKIANFLQSPTGADASTLAKRKSFVLDSITQAVRKLRELKEVAQLFSRSIVNQVRI